MHDVCPAQSKHSACIGHLTGKVLECVMIVLLMQSMQRSADDKRSVHDVRVAGDERSAEDDRMVADKDGMVM